MFYKYLSGTVTKFTKNITYLTERLCIVYEKCYNDKLELRNRVLIGRFIFQTQQNIM